MNKQSWVWFFLLLAGGSSCHKKSKTSEQVPVVVAQPSSPRPCPGTAAKVRENCGCNPVDNSLITVVETLQINQTIKSRVQSCAQGKFGLDVTSAVSARGDFQSCVTQDTEVPKEVMTQLMSAVDQAMEDNSRHQQELSSWLVCYELQTGVAAEKKTTEIKDCDGTSVDACQKACDANKTQSCATLGGIYLLGEKASKDTKKAAGFYQKACENLDAKSCHALGLLYFNGGDLPKETERAALYFAKACQLGNQESCNPPTQKDPLEGRH